MNKFYSITKLILVCIFVALSVFVNWNMKDPSGSIVGIVTGIAFIEALTIYGFESGAIK